MADSRVLIEIISTAKGLKVVAKDTEKLATNVDKVDNAQKKADKSGKNYHKTEKGIHQANLSSAKGFSKMQQSIGGGSSGLVGAYATLAANVFAATAAFNALRGAAQVETLIEGFTFLAETSGRTSTVIAANIQSITGNALSMEEAMRASSLAISSGFSTTQLERLTLVGRNASIALGRNLGDAIDRLVRGVAKLEPEILDELGIMVRLDTATRKYAASLGKTAGDLTDFERRQAFLNEAISQGEEKYAALTAAVDLNQFDKLAGTFANMTHSLLNFVNQGLKPFISFFAQSQVAMFGAITFLAKGVIGTMFPVLTDLGAKFTATAQKAHHAANAIKTSSQKAFDASEMKVGGIKTKKGDPAGFVALQKSAKAGTTTTIELKKASNGLNKSIALRKKNIENGDQVDKKIKKAQLKRLVKMRDATDDLIKKEKERTSAGVGGARSAGRANEQDILAQGAQGIGGAGGIEGFKIAGKAFGEFREEVKITSKTVSESYGSKGQSTMQAFGQSTRNAFKLGAGGARLFGAALVNAIPFIGQMIFAFGVLKMMYTKFFGESKKVTDAFKQLGKITDSISDKVETLAKTQELLSLRSKNLSIDLEAGNTTLTTSQVKFQKVRLEGIGLANTFKVTAGVVSELADGLAKVGDALEAEGVKESTVAAQERAAEFKAMYGAEFNLMNRFAVLLHDQNAAQFGGATAAEIHTASLAKQAAQVHDGNLQFRSFTVEAMNLFNALTAASPAMAKQVDAAFGEEGFAGRLKEIAEGSENFAIKNRMVQAEMRKAEKFANENNVAIESLGSGFEELTKKMVAFADRNAKKNTFITQGKDIDVFGKKIKELVRTQIAAAAASELAEGETAESVGLANAKKLLSIEIGEEGIQQLLNQGISYSSIIESLTTINEKTGEVEVSDKNIVELVAQQYDTYGNMLETFKDLKKEREAVFKMEQSITANAIKQNEIRLKELNARQRGSYELTPAQEMAQAKKVASEKSALLKKETNDKVTAAAEVFKKDFDAIKLSNSENDPAEVKRKQQAIIDAYTAEYALIKEKETEKGKIIADVRATELDKAGTEGTTLERLASLGEARDGTESFQTKIKDMQNASQPMLDTLKSMGPDGEFAAAAIEGTLSIASSIGKIGDASLTTADRVGAAADVIGAIGSIMAASSKQQIAEVDKQIAAEKNRDGKSKESLAKIAAMEKKKDQMKRKAFEQNKKMQMAETVVNTAAAIMAQKGNLPMMILMGILGAAQLAVIAKTSYQGGSAAVEQPAKQKLSIGKRNNSVDTSRAVTGGELSFLRGAQGVGSNANSFTPGGAAGMKRSYAAGGEILVGEQGPEVIRPTADGYNVIPNDRMGGGTTNANFTINAVDAAGVEEVLMKQRGNIIGMIREAAHEHGEEFIEAVNPNAYGIPMEK